MAFEAATTTQLTTPVVGPDGRDYYLAALAVQQGVWEHGEGGAPLVPAFAQGIQALFWCDHCRVWHRHGLGPGHRSAHCATPGSPYSETGYVLVMVGPMTRAAEELTKRRARESGKRSRR